MIAQVIEAPLDAPEIDATDGLPWRLEKGAPRRLLHQGHSMCLSEIQIGVIT